MTHIMVVDDEPDVRELFNITLKMAGFATTIAKNGMEAVEVLQTNGHPDLVLLDLMMPHMDGFGFVKFVRENYSDQPFRVLVATAKLLEPEDQEFLGRWPVVGILNKGDLDIGQMVTVVNNALDRDPYQS